MLVLSRKLGEGVVLQTAAGPVAVKISAIDRGVVRLAFDAPPAVKILREELLPARPAPK